MKSTLILMVLYRATLVLARCRDPLCESCISEEVCFEDRCPRGYGYCQATEENHGASCQVCTAERCLECNCDGDCTRCEDGYTAYQNLDNQWECILSVDSYQNCIKWLISTCDECQDGYYRDFRGLCTACSKAMCNNCRPVFYLDACFGCKTGYRLTQRRTCEECSIERCVTCSEGAATCESCEPGYGYDAVNNVCTGCADRLCDDCSSNYTVCASCVTGAYMHEHVCQPKDYEMSIGTCSSKRLDCRSRIPSHYYGKRYWAIARNSQFYGIAVSCLAGFYRTDLDNPYDCARRECNIDNCEYCTQNNSHVCERCGDGYLIQNGDCEACSVPHCRVCLSVESCLICDDDYILNTTGECHLPEFECGPNCNECNTRSGVCLLCEEGYYYHQSDKLCTRDNNIGDLERMVLRERTKILKTVDPVERMIEIAGKLKEVGETRNNELNDEIQALKSAANAARDWDLKRQYRDLQNIDKMIRNYQSQVLRAANGVTKNFSTKRNVSLMRQLKRTDLIRLVL